MFKKFVGKLSYANVMATVALFVALGGGAYAVKNAPKDSVTSKSIKDGSVHGVDVKDNSLTGADVDESRLTLPPGPTGDQGPKGDQGIQGPPGTDGIDGQDATSFLTAKSDGLGGSITKFGTLSGHSASSQVEQDVATLSPHQTVVMRNLVVWTTSQPSAGCAGGPGCAWTFTLRANGADTGLACTIGGIDTKCDSGGATAVISPDSRLSIMGTFSGGAFTNATDARIGLQVTSP